ncbi:MAG: hypothetical protein ACTSPQ_19025 [Candidatus Helarchaeota archaeon]
MIWRKLFIFLGIPLLVFYIFMIITYNGFLGSIWTIALIVGICCLRINRIWRRSTKLAISMFIFMFIFISNPLYWPQQITRQWNPTTIITPSDPSVQQLNLTSSSSLWEFLNNSYSINSTYFYHSLTEQQQVQYIEDFIIYKIKYQHSFLTYGMLYYLATPSETLSKGVGDNKSRAIVLTSFLIYMGYNAWAIEAPFEWYVKVFLKNGTEINLINSNENQPIAMVNHQSKYFKMSFIEICIVILLHDFINLPIANTIQQPLFWMIFIPLGFFISYLLVLVIRTSGVPTDKKKMTNILFGGTLINLGILFTYGMSTLYPTISALLVIITLVLCVQLVSHNFFMDPENVDLEYREKKKKENNLNNSETQEKRDTNVIL